MALNPFQALGLPLRFDLEPAAIQRAYLARVAAIHPDLAEQDAAAAAELNLARETLNSPEARADLLLRLRGGPGKEEDKSLPPGFLVEIMETREAAEAALASNDPGERARWTRWAREQRAEYVRAVGKLFESLGTEPTAAALKQIRTTLNAWRYIERLLEQLDPAYNPATADFRSSPPS